MPKIEEALNPRFHSYGRLTILMPMKEADIVKVLKLPNANAHVVRASEEDICVNCHASD
jgi:hypothetical protein